MTHELHFKLLPGEAWFGAHITEGYTMPITESTTMQTDTCLIRSGNQATPLFVSTKGRYLWSEEGYVTKWQCGDVCCTSEKAEITLYDGFETLRGAYLAASKAHFPFDGKLPNELMFKNPQYCTWIHLAVYQKQEDILAFAKSILDAGMPAGELIIDDGWQITFGHWDFDPEKFTDPKQMIKELHDLGFKVIMWICPFVSKKAPVYQWMAEHDMLVRSSDGSVASRTWWNGEDPVLDLSNPASLKWFQDLADHLMADYGVDGFKQDAGDSYFYEDDDMTYIPETTANDQSLLWAQTARKYEFNELRACFKGGGWGITQRLGDKSHSWDKNGLNTLIPNALLQGISGYPYSCPDMIGGGEISSFKEVLGLGSFREKSEDEFDTELLTRWCQCSALMPMMQFSFALWNLKMKLSEMPVSTP